MSPAADTHALNARLLRFRSHPEQEDPYALAEDLIAARRYGDARGVAVSAQTDDSATDARLLVLEARAWYMDRDLVRAQAALVRSAKLDPYCAEAFRWLGEVLLKRGDPARSQRALERAVELAPGDEAAQRLLERARQLTRHSPNEAEAMARAPARQPPAAPPAAPPTAPLPESSTPFPPPTAPSATPVASAAPARVVRPIQRTPVGFPSPFPPPPAAAFPAEPAAGKPLPSPPSPAFAFPEEPAVGRPSPFPPPLSPAFPEERGVGIPSPFPPPASVPLLEEDRFAPPPPSYQRLPEGAAPAERTKSEPGLPHVDYEDFGDGAREGKTSPSRPGARSSPGAEDAHPPLRRSRFGTLPPQWAAVPPPADPLPGASSTDFEAPTGARSTSSGFTGAASSPGMQRSTGAGMNSSPGTQRSAAGTFTSAGLQHGTSPGRSSAQGTRSAVGTFSSAGVQDSTDAEMPSAPGMHRSTGAGTSSSPGLYRGAPGAGTPSSPGIYRSSGDGSTSSPGMQRSSGAGSTSSPGMQQRSSSAGSTSSPGMQRSSGAGSTSSPGMQRSSGAGSTSSPGMQRSSGAGSMSSPGREHSTGAGAQRAASSPGALAGGGRHTPPPWEVPVEVREAELYAAPPRARTSPGTDAAAAAPVRRDPASGWDAPSVVAAWPALEPLSDRPPDDDDARPRLDSSAGYASFGTAATIYDATSAGAGAYRPASEPVPAAPDLRLGATAHQPDDPIALLRSLQRNGIFEPGGEPAPAPVWTAASQVARGGTRLRGTLIGVWVVSLLLLAGGYFGWRQWIAYRHARAAQLVAKAGAAAFESDYARLVDAERYLREARDNDPRSSAVPATELFVHAQRVLENGSRELSSLRAVLARAERLGQVAGDVKQELSSPLAVARAVLAVYSGTSGEAVVLIDKALGAAKGEPALLYVVGRLQQRLGRAEAAGQLQAAAAAAPDLIAAALALAELHYERGEEQDALAGLDAVLKRRPQHVRARLWQLFVTADSQDPARSLSELDALTKQARNSAPIDRILWALSRARLLRRNADQAKAAEALREALAAGASEPRLLALVAGDARRAGQLGVAQQAASQAAAAAPQSLAYRALLASILLERHDGERALKLMADLPQDEPALARMRARAALQTGDVEALRAGLAALDAQLKAGDKGTEALSLKLRLRAALEPKSELLSEAKALLRKAPSDPDALNALGEVALALRERREAVSAFEQLVRVTPEDAEAHYLLGRARRMATDAKGAEAAFRRALELSPGYVGALAALGGLLLDSGKYAEADTHYQELSGHSALAGRLGRAEALIGLGRLDDALVQVTGLPEALRDGALAREVAAKLAIARGKPGEALTLLRPLIESDQRRAETLALHGDALYAADQVNSAAGAYEAALDLDSELPEALIGRANVHLRAERQDEAVVLLREALEVLERRLRAPELRARALMLMGRAYVQRDKRGDLERGREMLRQAVQLPKPPAETYFWLGESLGGKKTPESAEAFRRYLELEPKGEYADRARRALGPLGN